MGELVTGQAATYVEELWVETEERYQIICITRDVQKVVSESGIKDGLVLVNPMHITASCYVNDLEYGLHHDIMKWLEKLAPFYGSDGKDGEEYHHHNTGEDNGDAHLKRQLLGQQVTMPVKAGRLCLVRWPKTKKNPCKSGWSDLMSNLSEPDHMTDMAVELGIERGHWGSGKASFSLQVSQRHCNKAGVAHGGLYTLMLDMALGGSLVCTLKKEEWCATTQLNVSFINAARPDEKMIAEGNLE